MKKENGEMIGLVLSIIRSEDGDSYEITFVVAPEDNVEKKFIENELKIEKLSAVAIEAKGYSMIISGFENNGTVSMEVDEMLDDCMDVFNDNETFHNLSPGEQTKWKTGFIADEIFDCFIISGIYKIWSAGKEYGLTFGKGFKDILEKEKKIDFEDAKSLFLKSGLSFPNIPEKLVDKMKKKKDWVYSTRELICSPYNLFRYIDEVDKDSCEDYAIISHSGHGSNSYFLQYYLVNDVLQLFLFIAWGGVYIENDQSGNIFNKLISMCDKLTSLTTLSYLRKKEWKIRVIAADTYEYTWTLNCLDTPPKVTKCKSPEEVLESVLTFLKKKK